MSENNGEPEELVISSVKERLSAYKGALEKSKQVEKTTKVPVFKVEEGMLEGSFMNGSFSEGGLPDLSERSGSVNPNRPDGFFGSASELSYTYERPSGFFGEEAEDLGFPQDQSHEQVQETMLSARDKIKALINKFEPQFAEEEEDEDPAYPLHFPEKDFNRLQEQYITAVEKLRPAGVEFTRYEGGGQAAFDNLRQDYDKENEKKEVFGDMQDRWQDLDGAQQDNRWYEWCVTAQDLPELPQRNSAESENEHEIGQKEDEITSQWIEFTDKVVETAEKIKAESDDDLSVDEDMAKWREEAKRLKADAARRKKRKEAMLERRKKRQEAASKRHTELLSSRNELSSRRREQEGTRRVEGIGSSRAREEDELQRKMEEMELAEAEKAAEEAEMEDALKAGAEKAAEEEEETIPDITGGDDSDDDDSSTEVDQTEVEESTTANNDSEKISEVKSDDKKKAKAKKTKKDKKDKSKKTGKKAKDTGKEIEVKAPVSKTAIPGRPCGNDDDMTDGPVERKPTHIDGMPWKNPLKFWTNKPKKLSEVGSKYIMKTLPRTDCFRRTEKSANDNASFYWFKVEGDFDVMVKIKGNFRSSYDKAGIMLREDDKNWVLSGIEYFNGELNHSTCITRGVSDWSLSPVPAEAADGLWICIKRVEGKVECYFSLDIRKWVQTRQGLFTNAQTLKVGIAAACPMGEPFKVVFEKFRLKKNA